MFFDAVLALRHDAPAAFQLVVSAAALFSAAFLLTVSFTFTTRRWLGREAVALFLATCAGMLGALDATSAHAVELILDRDAATLPADAVSEQTWITAADTVKVEGTLHGDLIVFGDRVEISGIVDGNVVSGARKLEISGRVTGSVAAFGDRVRIVGEVEGNVYAVSERTTVTESGKVGRDFFGAGDGVLLAGTVARDVTTFGDWLDVSGTIGRDLSAHAEHAEIGSRAHVGGDAQIEYSHSEDDVEIDPRAAVEGSTTVERDESTFRDESSRYASGHFYAFFFVSLAAAFATGMLVFRVALWVFASSLQNGTDLLRALVRGFLALVAVPLACAIVALSVIGIPIAIMGVGTYVLCLYLSKIVIGAMVGPSILGRPDPSDWWGFGRPLLAGLGIVFVASVLPWIGGAIGFLVILAGLGVIVAQTRVQFSI